MAIIQSGASADVLTVGATSKAARTTPYADDGTPIVRVRGAAVANSDSFLVTGGMNDDNYRMNRVDRMGNAGVALNNVLFSEPFEGATISTPNRWTAVSTTFVPAQTAAGGYNFNSSNLTTASAASLLTSARYFPKFQKTPLHAKFRARALHVTNAVIEFGFGAPASQTTAPAVGAYFQITTAGVVQGVLTFNGVDQTTAAITMPGSWQNNYYIWDIVMDDDEVNFYIQDSSTGLIVSSTKIQIALTAIRHWNASRLPIFARIHNVTAPATAPNFILTSADVVSIDSMMNKSWGQTSAMMGLGGEVGPTTLAQTANYTNSVVPTTGTPSNTAAGYTTLGGGFTIAAPAGSEADLIMFAYTVPVPYSFICTGVDIDTVTLGANVATNPHVLQWFASPDQTAVSQATATNRRVTLGMQSFLVGALVGTLAVPISKTFPESPLVTHPGRIMVVGVRILAGAATASQTLRGAVAIRGYFE